MARVHQFWLVSIVVSAVLAAACGNPEDSNSPTSPSSSSGSRPGATIAGRVISSTGAASTSSATATAAATSSITVKVIGTNISTTVDGRGQFTLTEVPPGTVRIEFTGNGTNATIILSGVGEGDVLDITVMLNGNRATLQSELVEVEGAISGLGGACPSLTFTVRGRHVSTDAATTFEHGSCAGLRNATEVEVKGRVQSDGSLVATKVEVEDDDDDDDDEDEDEDDDRELKGTVSGLTGTCPVLTFVLNGTTVVTTNATKFEDNCGAVRNGRRAKAAGVRQANGQLLATKVEIDD